MVSTHLKNNCRIESFPPGRGENKVCLKPPASIGFFHLEDFPPKFSKYLRHTKIKIGRPPFGMSRKAIFFSETNSPKPKRKPQHIFQASKFQVRTLCLNWWLNQPLRMKNMSQNGLIFPNFRGEKKKSLKPANSFREGIHFTSPFPHSSKRFGFPGSSGTSFVRGRPGSPFLLDPQKYTKW